MPVPADDAATATSETHSNGRGYKGGEAYARTRPTPRTLREIRKRAGLSLTALGEASGVSPAVLSQIERGRLVATTEEADRIALALKLPAGALVLRTTLIYDEPA